MGKLKSIFELAENLSLVLTKLDTELGLAQPQLVDFINPTKTWGVKISDLRYATYPHKMQPNKFQVITMRYG